MDAWLTDQVKEALIRPCLAVSGHISRRLNARFGTGQEIDERALTEDLVDRLDSSMPENVWGTALSELRDRQIYLSTSIRKSKFEHRTGADIGFILRRQTYRPVQTNAQYACLVQCKRVDQHGEIRDFYHQVPSSKRRQSELMLEITPSSFYFLYVPSALVKYYCTIEPLAFLEAGLGCSVPAWNLGLLEHEGLSIPFLSASSRADVTGLLVVPALGVEAQQASGTAAKLDSILPNCIPFWYWFTQLFVPGFVGDRAQRTLNVARNVNVHTDSDIDFGVRFSIEIGLNNG